MKYEREVERKFVVEGLTYEEALEALKSRYSLVCDATSYDLYWEAPNVDFVRLRENSRELTVKVTDKGTVVDRIEENVKLDRDAMQACIRMNTLLYGEPMRLVKEFSVFHGYNFVVCLYKVEGDVKERVFLEVEAISLDIVDRNVANLMNQFIMVQVYSSLYQIFSEGL